MPIVFKPATAELSQADLEAAVRRYIFATHGYSCGTIRFRSQESGHNGPTVHYATAEIVATLDPKPEEPR